MAAHFLIYADGSDDPSPEVCAVDADDAQRYAANARQNGSPLACVVRLLTGVCPICHRRVSKLSGRNAPMTVDPDAEFLA